MVYNDFLKYFVKRLKHINKIKIISFNSLLNIIEWKTMKKIFFLSVLIKKIKYLTKSDPFDIMLINQ